MELAASLNKICRTCLSEKVAEMYCLFENTAEDDNLGEILSKCCDIQTENEEMPMKVCSDCKNKLLAFYEFKKNCEQNDFLLRTYLKRIVSKSTLENKVIIEIDTCTSDKENITPVNINKHENEAIKTCDCLENCICVITNDKNNSLNISDKVTENSEMNADREENVDPNILPYICKKCGKCFEKYKNLYRHQKIHEGKKPYLCSTCGKSFAQSNNLQTHMRIHSGNKPYSCQDCGKSFAQLSTLQGHLVTHTGERAFICSVCGKTFARSNALSKHMNIHTGERKYTCNLCNKSFKTASEQTRHLVVHTGEKKYMCTICGKAFNRASNLTVHKKIHTGLRPHGCRICGKRFIQLYVLNNHIKTHFD